MQAQMLLKELNIFPYYSQTFVSASSQEEILEKIREATKENIAFKESAYTTYQFNGTVGETSFQLSRIVQQANSFLPMLKGSVEATKIGCIIFVGCEMFYTTKVLLAIWTVLPLFIFIFNLFLANGLFYAFLALFFGLFNYIVTVANFHRQRKISMEVFSKVINTEKEE
jgi:hypothetical protein